MLARGLAARVGRLAHRRVASTATPASVVHRIELEPLTAEAFAPFGEICGTLSQAPPSLHVPGALTIYHTPFAADSPTNLLFIRYHDAPPLFSTLERHFHVTQGFLPVGGTASIMVVAAPTPREGEGRLPAPGALRAFLLDGTQGVVLHTAVWHGAPRPCPDCWRSPLLLLLVLGPVLMVTSWVTT